MNKEISLNLQQIADLLEEQHANPYRVQAYHNAAKTLATLKEPVENIVARKGIEGLIALPTIGEGIARCIYEYVAMGKMSRLESLRGGHDPIALFEAIPGVSPNLAHNIYDSLHIKTYEALEMAAHNGRLKQVRGMSPIRIEKIIAWLADNLGNRKPGFETEQTVHEPPVDLILSLDEKYRSKAIANELPKIAPKRFNPNNEPWLSIMHVSKGEWHFTLLFSNTARAHQLHKTNDWVVIYYYDSAHHESQHTVVTETQGVLKGKRVVRGREFECKKYYAITSR